MVTNQKFRKLNNYMGSRIGREDFYIPEMTNFELMWFLDCGAITAPADNENLLKICIFWNY